MKMNLEKTRGHLEEFEFTPLFVEELGWSNPPDRRDRDLQIGQENFQYQYVAELGGAMVLKISEVDVPLKEVRKKIHKKIHQLHYEHLLIFTDKEETKCLWSWSKDQRTQREHIYMKGQPGDLFLSKLHDMMFDISDFDERGNASITEVVQRLKAALDSEQVTKKFYNEFQSQHLKFRDYIKGIDNERDRSWYASILLNRLMFIYFLQRKGLLNKRQMNYLSDKFKESTKKSKNCYYEKFLKILFFQGFAEPPKERSPETNSLLGHIRYLNGGLFLKHSLEIEHPNITIADEAFKNLFELFERYTWNLNDTPGGDDSEINPDVLGYIFEKYINQKDFGAYYTRTEITEYLCERTIHQLILDRVGGSFKTMPDLLMQLDADLCKKLLEKILPHLTILDPACGSGAFLIAAMKTLMNIYGAIIGRIEVLNHPDLNRWREDFHAAHPNIAYGIKKRIITNNLFGVDIMEEGSEICCLRLFLALVASATKEEELEPLPNIDFNILAGNSLIGLVNVDGDLFEGYHKNLLEDKSYTEVVADYDQKVSEYRHMDSSHDDLRGLRDSINGLRSGAHNALNKMLLDRFLRLKIKYEEAVWDEQKQSTSKKGKPRAMNEEDVCALTPFHWGLEFHTVLKNGGFDIILTNPPWEVLQPTGKEFFEHHSDIVSKNKMTIKEFEREQKRLLKENQELRREWLDYCSRYPHQSVWFHKQFKYHTGKINLYKLFLEQCANLLKKEGQCGIVIPSGLYTDQGAKGLREMLFEKTRITGLFGFENRKGIFENVHKSFKFIVLTFKKDSTTKSFPAAFMRHDTQELKRFPAEGALNLSFDLISTLSPDTLSMMEFKAQKDIEIAKKMLCFRSWDQAAMKLG